MLDRRIDPSLSFSPVFAWSKKLPNFAVKHVDLSRNFGHDVPAWPWVIQMKFDVIMDILKWRKLSKFSPGDEILQ